MRRLESNSFVLDASAILASLKSEPGADVVDAVISNSVVSSVNLAEVVSNLANGGMPENSIRDLLMRLSFDIIPFDAEQAYDAGILRQAARNLGLSLGDRCCLSLARSLDLPVLTADRAWAQLSVGVEVNLVR